MNTRVTIALLLAIVLVMAGCSSADKTVEGACPEGWSCHDLDVRPFGGVDLLLVVDDSMDMAYEQSRLADELPAFIRDLLDPDPVTSVRKPIADLHLGVISTDMGAGGYIGTCTDRGDDGILRTEPDPSATGCASSYDPFHAYHTDSLPELERVEEALEWVGCMTQLGTRGCGMEMPLESAYRALVVHSEPGGPNAGFLRQDTAVMVFWFVGDDDCSVSDYALFDFTDTTLGYMDTRCINHPEYLHTVSHYVEGLSEIRESGGWPVIMGMAVGVPVGEDTCSGFADTLGGCLDLDVMVPTVTPSAPHDIVPVCATTMTSHPPAPRLVEFALGFGRDAFVLSFCNESMEPVLSGLTGRIGEILEEACDSPVFEMGWDDAGPCACNSNCRLVHVLDGDDPCPENLIEWDSDGDGRPNRVVGTGGEPVTACEVPFAGIRLGNCDLGCLAEGQTYSPGGEGWHLDMQEGVACPSVGFTEGYGPPQGATTFTACP